jgi:type IV pilus assembly protein PilX
MNNKQHIRLTGASRQNGAILLVTLVLLLLISLLGVDSIKRSTKEIKSSFNSAQKAVSFQNAENARITAIKVADTMAATLGAAPTNFSSVSGKGRYNIGGAGLQVAAPAVKTEAFWSNPANYVVSGDGHSSYAIEYLGRQDLTPDQYREVGTTVAVHVFRITLHDTTNSGAQTTLQSTYVTNCAGTC